MIRVGFVGMTHLGINSGLAVAARGFDVTCFDADRDLIAALKRGDLPVIEPGLPELLAETNDRVTFSADAGDLTACDVVYIAADVPTDDRAASDLTGIDILVRDTIARLNPTATLVVLCQVPPGYTRAIPLAPERRIYQVETLIFGRAVERAMHPERTIVGCADPEKPLPAAYQAVLAAFDCPILPMRYESAELAKISINMCLVASVSVANTLAELCENIGADWSEIVPALRLDKRIGPASYIEPGLGIAGGNLERDLATVLRLSERHGTDAGVVSAWLANSRYRRDWALRLLHDQVLSRQPAARIAVLGLAYKENTHSLKNSPSVSLLRALRDWRIAAFDPAVENLPNDLGHVTVGASALDVLTDADVLLIMTPWPEFRKLAPASLAGAMAGRTVIDPFRVLDGPACAAAGLTRHILGRAA